VPDHTNVNSMVEPSTRDTILDIAERMLAQRGFHGVSIRDIAGAAEIRTAAVFYHFASKAELVAATIRRFGDRAMKRSRALADQGVAPAAHIAAWVAAFGHDKLKVDAFCLAGMLAAERGGLPEPVVVALANVHEELIVSLADLFAMLDSPPASPRLSGEMVLSVCEGALLLARMSGNPALYRAITDASLVQMGLAPVSESLADT